MRRVLLVLLLALPIHAAEKTVTLLHFSDYHSHALPSLTEQGELGGVARAIGYMRIEKSRGALVFNGGDMMNKGAPAWSDRYGCAEWPWLNGVVDAMAFGNHDADYGREALASCESQLRYPLLSANTAGFQPYVVLKRSGVRIGVFAVAGTDFSQLVKTPGLTFGDPVAAARDVVRRLRHDEHVDAVVMIGHEHAEADYALAKAVPGIDLIFGSHSHLKRELTQIPGTKTWFISPSQYLTYISRVRLTFRQRTLTGVTGELVPVNARMPEDLAMAQRVAAMQQELERDPRYRDLFLPLGRLENALSVAELAQRTLDAMRSAVHADVALSTMSSFRAPLAAGELTTEALRAALPYDNEIVVCTMTGAQLQRVLDYSASRRGTDNESWISGVTHPEPSKTYRVATTDYQASSAYRDVFSCEQEKSGLRVRDQLRKAIVP